MSSTDELSTSTSVQERNSAPAATSSAKSPLKRLFDHSSADTSPKRKFVTSQGASFSAHRLPGTAYVDKTGLVAKLVLREGGYFVHRPRKFGKSVLLDTIHTFFKGNKEDFEGLKIYDDPAVSWDRFPVISLSMNEVRVPGEVDQYDARLASMVRKHAKKNHDIRLEDSSDSTQLFSDYIEDVYLKYKKGVVILIDEYDAPLLSCLDNENAKLLKGIGGVLSSFYSVLKSRAAKGQVRFRYVTGITKLARDSMGSTLNDLDSIDDKKRFPEMATLCGFTEQEIKTDYAQDLSRLAVLEEKTEVEFFEKIENLYSGYNWHLYGSRAALVYNPYAINCVFLSDDLKPCWADEFLPSWLKKFFRSCDFFDIANILSGTVPWSGRIGGFADRFDVLNPNSVRLVMWECGLLNACFDGEERGYLGRCRYPNQEVRSVVERMVLDDMKKVPEKEERRKFHDGAQRMIEALRSGNIQLFMNEIAHLIDMIPNVVFGGGEIDVRTYESFYHTVVYTSLYTLPSVIDDVEFESEKTAAAGRGDFVVYSKTTAYITELKFEKPLDQALRQIEEKGYYRFPSLEGRHSKKRILAVAVQFKFDKHAKKITEDHDVKELRALR